MIAHTPPTYPPEHEARGAAFGATMIRAGGCRLIARSACAELVGMSMTDLSAVEQGTRVHAR